MPQDVASSFHSGSFSAQSARESAKQDALFKSIYHRKSVGTMMSAAGEGFLAGLDPDGEDGWAAGIGIGLQRGGQLVREGNELDQARLAQSFSRQDPMNAVADTNEAESDELKAAVQERKILDNHNSARQRKVAGEQANAPQVNPFRSIRTLLAGMPMMQQLEFAQTLLSGGGH